MELLFALFALGILAFPVVIIFLLSRVWVRAERLEKRFGALVPAFDRLRGRVQELEETVQTLRDWLAQSAREAVRPPVVSPVVDEPPAAAQPVVVPAPPPEMVLPQPPPAAEPPEAEPIPSKPTIAEAPPEPVIPQEPPPRPEEAPVSRPAPARTFDWESLVGVKLFSWVAGIALALAAVFFLRYSIERGWLLPAVRMAIGLLVGTRLLVLCELKAARRYPITANALDASAIAILFATCFAAHARWELIGTPLAFALLILVTALAVWLSIRRDSAFIALLGLLGGFATPALLSTGENRPIPLFGYLLVLNAGLSWVAFRKNWRLLTLLSLAFTTFYQWGWVVNFLNEGQLSLAAGIFLVFPILGFAAVAVKGMRGAPKIGPPTFEQTANLGALLPLIFALYMPAIPAYGGHLYILFGFLLCLDLGLMGVAVARSAGALHFAGGLSTLLVFAIWLQVSYRHSAYPAVLIFLSLFFLLYLLSPVAARRLGLPLRGPGARASYVAPLLVAVFAVLAWIEPECAAPGLLFGTLFILTAILALVSVTAGLRTLYILNAVFVVAAQAVWTSRHLKTGNLEAGLALYGVFGLLFVAVPFVDHWRNSSLPAARGLVFSSNACVFLGITSHLFLYWVAGFYALAVPPWPLFVVMAVLNLAIAGVALQMRRGELHFAAVVASSSILIRWTATSGVA
ncbi:MAG: DUF2339 domain-containing protein, partial [Acidobacteria bacterium]|nr:DUF2339 domain-containing protein [Acidobacteriota bacterium]